MTALVPRLAVACRTLDERRVRVEELDGLIERLDGAKLVPVAGARRLVGRLAGTLKEAVAVLDELAAATEGHAPAVDRLEELVNRAEWSVATTTVARLTRQITEQEDVVRALVEELGTQQLAYDRFDRVLTAAENAGLPIRIEDLTLRAEINGAVQRAEDAADRGRFDAVAVEMRRVWTLLVERRLADAGAFDSHVTKIDKDRADLEQREWEMSRRAELFLIAAPRRASAAPGAAVSREYRVLLRRPSTERTQESNLHDSAEIEDDDSLRFRGTIDEIAAAATAGLRSAGAEEPADGRTRGILTGLPGTMKELPTLRLERVGRLMYSLLIPDAMQRLIDESRSPLTVTSNDLELPWELLHDGDRFLCLKRPFARMPVVQTFPRRSRLSVKTSNTTWNVLLVHSDPDGDLAESAAEIRQIAATLHALPARVNVETLAGEEANRDLLTRHLSSGHYDLIHYAGHAGFDTRDPAKSFLQLHNRSRFYADRIQRILEGRPIVFLNACDTSQTRNENDEASTSGIVAQAQGLASAFVYGGAQACIGTLWPVFDDSARDLADAFYKLLFERQRVGEALRRARATSYEADEDRLTWAAYALYGDPLSRLRQLSAPPAAR